MVLSDRDIRAALKSKRIAIEPLFEGAIQPASVDLHLGRVFLVFDTGRFTEIDVKKPVEEIMRRVEVADGDPFILHPGEFALGITLERTTLANDIVGRLEGKSSLGRVGIIVHATAGYIDPGNSLHITLELHNIAPLPVKLYPEMAIAQISFLPLTSEAEDPYNNGKRKYYDATEPQASKIHKNFQKE